MINKDNKIQIKMDYVPLNWMFKEVDDHVVILILEPFNEHNDIFRLARKELISERMQVSLNTATCNGDAISNQLVNTGTRNQMH